MFLVEYGHRYAARFPASRSTRIDTSSVIGQDAEIWFLLNLPKRYYMPLKVFRWTPNICWEEAGSNEWCIISYRGIKQL